MHGAEMRLQPFGVNRQQAHRFQPCDATPAVIAGRKFAAIFGRAFWEGKCIWLGCGCFVRNSGHNLNLNSPLPEPGKSLWRDGPHTQYDGLWTELRMDLCQRASGIVGYEPVGLHAASAGLGITAMFCT